MRTLNSPRIGYDRHVATRKQVEAAKRNVKKAQQAATKKRTIANLPASTRRELGKQAARGRARGGEAGHRLEDRNREQLYEIAQKEGIPGRSKMGKWDLIQAIRKGRGERRRRLSAMPWLVRLAVAWAINAAALWAADALWGSVRIHGWAAYLIGSAVLGVANTVLKPVLALLTLPLIIVTLGFAYLAINIAMVALAEWIAPNLSIDGFWTYVGVVVVVWIVNWIGREVVDRLEEGTRRPRILRI